MAGVAVRKRSHDIGKHTGYGHSPYITYNISGQIKVALSYDYQLLYRKTRNIPLASTMLTVGYTCLTGAKERFLRLKAHNLYECIAFTSQRVLVVL